MKLLLILFISAAAGAKAQDIPLRLDSLFTGLVKNNEFNGNVLAAANGRVMYQHSFGYADAEHQLLNAEETTFNLASVSKIFTAVAILQLKQESKLSLDDPYVKYFPDIPWSTITLRQLLSHTSGLADNQIFEKPYQENPDKIYTLNDLIPAFRNDKRGLLFKPGEKFSYSNTGFGLLALLVEKLSGMKFQDYLKKYIFLPAGMTHTYIETPLIPVADPDRAIRYEFISYAPDRLKRVDSVKRDHISAVILGAIVGPDCVVSTTGDLLKFDQALYSGKLLKPEILEEAFRPTLLNNGEKAVMGVGGHTDSYYGLGWMILCDSTYGKVVWHSGGDPGEVTVFLRNITRKQTIIVLDNVTHRGLLSQGINTFYILNGGPALVFKRSLARAYARQLHEKGADAAAVLFNGLKTDTAHYYPMNERELNGMSYDMLDDGYMTEAMEALKINTLLFPDSWNAYDSYAEALARAGKKEEAVAMYKRSIAINPGNQGGKNALKRLEKTGME